MSIRVDTTTLRSRGKKTTGCRRLDKGLWTNCGFL